MAGCDPSRRSTGDLDEVVARGTLRVIVRPGFGEVVTRVEGGSERELLTHLATRLGVRVEWIEASRHDQMLTWLATGVGDVAVGRFAPAWLEREGLVGSAPLDWVEDVMVARGGEVRTLALQPSLRRWLRAAERVPDAATTVPVAEEMPLEEIVRRVASGRYQATVVDSGLVNAGLLASSGVTVVGRISASRPVVWGLRLGNRRLLAAIDEFLFSERVLASTPHLAECRDLDQVRAANELRLVTRNSPTTCTDERGRLQGFEYELAQAFAERLGVRLVLAIPPRGIDPYAWLERGHGDLVALHEPPAPERRGHFGFSVAYRTVDLVAVTSAERRDELGFDDLAGQRVAAPHGVRKLCENLPFAPAMSLVAPGGRDDALAALGLVTRGAVDVAIVESDAAAVELAERQELRRGPVVLTDLGLRWAFNPSSATLLREADAFLGEMRRSGFVGKLADALVPNPDPAPSPAASEIPRGALTPYDEELKRAAVQHDVDWRLLASVMYEESRFDANAIGPGGAAGLFQFMPTTAQALGIDDPTHPIAAIEGGARYLRRLMSDFDVAEPRDRLAMAVASYNVGSGHVHDARSLAVQMELDPNRWEGSVEEALLLLDDAEVARDLPSGVCRCRRAVSYTRRVLRRYETYRDELPPN